MSKSNQERDAKTGLDIGLPMVSKWDPEALEREKQELIRIGKIGPLGRMAGYAKLTGPGWLQAALTLGGGSSSASLWAGALMGYSILWSQPFAMFIGIIMMMALAHQTLSTRVRPFQAVERFAHPSLAWGWALSSLLASIIWSLPQFSLCGTVIDDMTGLMKWTEKPGLPGFLTAQAESGEYLFRFNPFIPAILVAIVTLYVTWNYGKSGRGIRFFEHVLKVFVAGIILAFLIVVIRTGIHWGPFFKGMFGIGRSGFGFYVPGDIEGLGVLITGAATAVGINMTFLFPYTLLARGWGREHRSLAKFDLGLGMFIPFVIATSCIVIASANTLNFEYQARVRLFDAQISAIKEAKEDSRFANQAPSETFLTLFEIRAAILEGLRQTPEAFEGETVVGSEPKKLNDWLLAGIEENRNALREYSGELPESIRKSLQETDPFQWHIGQLNGQKNGLEGKMKKATYMASSLEEALGPFWSHVVFGLGILGMVVSSIIMLMLVSGFIMAEITRSEVDGPWYKVGLFMPVVGILGPIYWSKVGFWMAVPTSSICYLFLPIAYISFMILHNSKEYLGEDRPEGTKRILWNLAMGLSIAVVTIAGIYNIYKQVPGYIGKIMERLFG